MNRKEMSIRELRQFVELQDALKQAAAIMRERRQAQPEDDDAPDAPAPRRYTTMTGEDDDQ